MWVFWVNRVFGYFIIYPKYPKTPKYYLFIFCVSLIQSIRITDSILFDYADLPYHPINLSLHPADFSRTSSPTSVETKYSELWYELVISLISYQLVSGLPWNINRKYLVVAFVVTFIFCNGH